jgi:hypothetical protein
MGNYEKNLIGLSIPLMEVDDEESSLNSEMIYNAEKNADIEDIIENFGKEEFKEIYLNSYNEIKSLDLESRRYLCQKLLEKTYELYSFEFTPKLEFSNDEEIDEFLKFIEYLEFDYIDFLSKIFKGFDLNLLKKDPDTFLNTYIDEIILRSLEESFSLLISNFFRTNNKYNIIEFLKSKIEKDKMLLILRIMERGIENE